MILDIEPHPLDFDWRYTSSTVREMCNLANAQDKVICVGTPSIAEELISKEVQTLLIDRQPFTTVDSHIVASIEDEWVLPFVPDLAFLDPPWYPKDLELWVTKVAACMRIGSKILVSVWPKETRPKAAKQLLQFQSTISTWAEVRYIDLDVQYQLPLFEACAIKAKKYKKSLSPLRGRCLEITIKKQVIAPTFDLKKATWARYIFNEYQLAVKLDSKVESKLNFGVSKHPLANGWIWSSISKRAKDRNQINLWSSHNEVAVLSHSNTLIKTLDELLSIHDVGELINWGKLPEELQSWDFPTKPIKRAFKWFHHE